MDKNLLVTQIIDIIHHTAQISQTLEIRIKWKLQRKHNSHQTNSNSTNQIIHIMVRGFELNDKYTSK